MYLCLEDTIDQNSSNEFSHKKKETSKVVYPDDTGVYPPPPVRRDDFSPAPSAEPYVLDGSS